MCQAKIDKLVDDTLSQNAVQSKMMYMAVSKAFCYF